MSVKVHISYTEEGEELEFLTLLKPVLDRFKVKKSVDKPQSKHLYFIPRKTKKDHTSA